MPRARAGDDADGGRDHASIAGREGVGQQFGLIVRILEIFRRIKRL
ncbi:hypothetical protein [Sphingobium sp.]|nr:hypothetical protein [Sphingobium sp.]